MASKYAADLLSAVPSGVEETMRINVSVPNAGHESKNKESNIELTVTRDGDGRF